MSQTTDITINGAGYMIEPGSSSNPGYKRLQDGHPEGRTQRLAITDFFGGQRRHLQLERDQFGDSLAVGPALGGQGVKPWGVTVTYTVAALTGKTLPHRDTPIPFAIVRDRLYFAIGKTLYQGPVTIPDYTNVYTALKTFANDITDLCIYGHKALLLCFGAAADIVYYDTTTGTETVLFAGERGTYIAPYAGYAIWNDARSGSRPTVIRQGTGGSIETRRIDHDPIAITTADAELFVISKQAIYSYAGRVRDVMVNNPGYTVGGSAPAQIPGQEWSGDYTPFYQQGVYTERDDFRVFTGFGGRILAWIAGGIHELVKTGDRAGWRSTGLTGRRCFGGTVAAGYLIVCIESDSGDNEVWIYDGTGWWRRMQKPMAADGVGAWCNPLPIGSGHGLRNVIIFWQGSENITVLRLLESREFDISGGKYVANYPDTAQLVTSMLDAGERDKTKAWRKIGAVFASPVLLGNTSSGDAVDIAIDYSVDGGHTWTVLQYTQKIGNTLPNTNFSIGGALSGVLSRFIMLRVRWLGVLDWAPVLVGLWAEYEVMDTPARRRKWQLRIHARDQEVDRDGAVFSRTGRQLISELWQAWEQDTVLTFRDVDYDDAPTQRNVRIVGISEAVTQPADSTNWGESTITLNLVEV